MRKITIKDIAKAAGVHHTTVSRVVNDDPRISEETRNRVSKLLDEMHYVPNSAARSLGKGKTNTIAVISTSLFNEFHRNVMRGIELELVKTKYDLSLFSTSRFYLIGTKDRESIFKRVLYDRLAEAIILEHGEMYDEPLLKQYEQEGFPIVNIEGPKHRYGHSILYDNMKAAEMAVEYLISKGRKRIGLLIGHLGHVQSARERFAGYENAMKKHGIKVDKKLIFEDVHYSEHSAEASARQMTENNADAVFCATGDLHAARLMVELEKKQVSVPQDMSVIGFDDIESAALIGLTTVRQPLIEMGKRAFEIAVDHIEGRITKQVIETFRPELIIRKTA